MCCVLQELRPLKLAEKGRDAFEISKFSPVSCTFQVQQLLTDVLDHHGSAFFQVISSNGCFEPAKPKIAGVRSVQTDVSVPFALGPQKMVTCEYDLCQTVCFH